jgi:hypothetical protein
MSSALSHVASESSLVAPVLDRELERHGRHRMGVPHSSVANFAAAPWVARAVVDAHLRHALACRGRHVVGKYPAIGLIRPLTVASLADRP